MSQNSFYSDLDLINKKGVLVTGHGKGIVQNNDSINGKYICNDIVRLVVDNGTLYGYQGYILQDSNELTHIEYLLYLYAESEENQPLEPMTVSPDEYLTLCKHNIEKGDSISLFFRKEQPQTCAYDELRNILKGTKDSVYVAIPYTMDEKDRALFINTTIK